ncbi:hypothetical protein Tco_0942155 [Tanacetum coccineum]
MQGDPQVALKDTGIFDSGCSRHMTGNKSYLTDYQDYEEGFVAFAGNSRGGRITGKSKIKTANLDFKDVYFVKELKFNLFSVSQMCDKKNSILITETECFILSPEFKLYDENHVMLKIPRKDNMYSFNLKNIVPSKGYRELEQFLRHCELHNGLILLLRHCELHNGLTSFSDIYKNIGSRNVLIFGIPSPFVIVLTLWSLLLGPGAVPTDTTLSNRNSIRERLVVQKLHKGVFGIAGNPKQGCLGQQAR